MQKRVSVFWKVVTIVVLVVLFQVPIHMIKGYTVSKSESYQTSSVSDFISESADKVSQLFSPTEKIVCTDNELCGSEAKLDLQANYDFNVRLLDYSALFMGLAFILLLVFDVVSAAKVHWVQYMVFGIGLLIFYLLSLVFAGYMGFTKSYFIAALICSALLIFYLGYVFKRVTSSIGFALCLMLLFGITYPIISLLDNMLLFGVLVLFVLFVAFIVLTRHVDWNEKAPQTKAGATKISE